MVNEIVIAIDPALRKIEEILLWKSKFKSGAVFTFCHFLFWMFQNFNIRTYCTISSICLMLHLLDAYRTKKRREILRLQLKKSNVIENISPLGRYIIFIHEKLTQLWKSLEKLKQRNRLQYFLLVFVFWSMALIIGIKIRGFYLTYFLFWIVFFVPAILHYEIPKRILSKALPLLEQLDQSMKYERRSILDKSELLVDVKLPKSIDDDEQEDEYLNSFKLDDLENMKKNQRRAFENLEDEDDEDDLEEEEIHDEEEELEVEENDLDTEEMEEGEENIYPRNNQRYRSHRAAPANLDTSDNDDSLLPDESLPNITDVYDFSSKNAYNDRNDDDYTIDTDSQIISGNKVVRRKGKNRPSLMDYYAESMKPASDVQMSTSSYLYTTTANNSSQNNSNYKWEYGNSVSMYNNNNSSTEPVNSSSITYINSSYTSGPNQRYLNENNKNPIGSVSSLTRRQNEQDIDETFDFLDEELNKYDS